MGQEGTNEFNKLQELVDRTNLQHRVMIFSTISRQVSKTSSNDKKYIKIASSLTSNVYFLHDIAHRCVLILRNT